MMAVQSVYLESGLGPSREPAGAWSAQLEMNTEYFPASSLACAAQSPVVEMMNIHEGSIPFTRSIINQAVIVR
jgi:hypothetical protein